MSAFHVTLIILATDLIRSSFAGQCNNFDFEDGTKNGWTKSGNAFDSQPTFGDNPAARPPGEHALFQGDWWIGTFEDRPRPDLPGGKSQGDVPKGTLTSPPIRITGPRIGFLVGGTCVPSKARVELLVGGHVVRTVSPKKCSDEMEKQFFDVDDLIGQTAVVRLVDASSEGHLNFDDLKGDFYCGPLVNRARGPDVLLADQNQAGSPTSTAGIKSSASMPKLGKVLEASSDQQRKMSNHRMAQFRAIRPSVEVNETVGLEYLSTNGAKGHDNLSAGRGTSVGSTLGAGKSGPAKKAFLTLVNGRGSLAKNGPNGRLNSPGGPGKLWGPALGSVKNDLSKTPLSTLVNGHGGNLAKNGPNGRLNYLGGPGKLSGPALSKDKNGLSKKPFSVRPGQPEGGLLKGVTNTVPNSPGGSGKLKSLLSMKKDGNSNLQSGHLGLKNMARNNYHQVRGPKSIQGKDAANRKKPTVQHGDISTNGSNTDFRNLSCKDYLVEINTGLQWDYDFLFPLTELFQSTKNTLELTILEAYGEDKDFMGEHFKGFSQSKTSKGRGLKANMTLKFRTEGPFLEKLLAAFGPENILGADCYGPPPSPSQCAEYCPGYCLPSCAAPCCTAAASHPVPYTNNRMPQPRRYQAPASAKTSPFQWYPVPALSYSLQIPYVHRPHGRMHIPKL